MLITLLGNSIFLFTNDLEKYPLRFSYDNIQLGKNITFLVNPDAFAFVGAAIQPSHLLEENHFRQSRPGYAILGFLIGYPIYFLSQPFHSQIEKLMSNSLNLKNNEAERKKGVLYACFYLGYVLLNMFILIYALWIFDKTITITTGEWKSGTFLYCLPLFMLSVNQITKIYLYTPHLQLFNILTPILSLYYSLRILKKQITCKQILNISTIAGVGFLVYGNFIMLFISIVISCLWASSSYLLLQRSIGLLVKATLLFLLPTFLWIFFLKLNGISFYSAEVTQFRQFVWIIDSLKISILTFAMVTANNLYAFLLSTGSLVFPIAMLLIALLGTPNIKLSVHPYKLPFIICLLYALFYFCLGYYSDRLTIGLLPFILYFLGCFLNSFTISKTLTITLAIFAITLYIWTVLDQAPHFSNSIFYN